VANTFKKFIGIIDNVFQLGLSGPKLKNNSGAIEARDAADTVFANVSVATPTVGDHAATKSYVDSTSGMVRQSTAPADISGDTLWYNNSSGQFEIYFYDTSRSKWLSVSVFTWTFGKDTNADDQYMGLATMGSPSDLTAFLAHSDLTVVGLGMRARAGNSTKEFEFRKNGVLFGTPFNLVAFEYSNTELNLDMSSGENLQIYVNAAGASVSDTTALVYLRKRAS
jgi:hypothetical protein